jgi:hypothetical protein
MSAENALFSEITTQMQVNRNSLLKVYIIIEKITESIEFMRCLSLHRTLKIFLKLVVVAGSALLCHDVYRCPEQSP